MNKFDLCLIRVRELTAAYSAVAFGVGVGFLLVSATPAMPGSIQKRVAYDAGIGGLLAGCILMSASARGSQLNRRFYS